MVNTTLPPPAAGPLLFEDADPGIYEITIGTEVLRKLVLRIGAGQTGYVRVSTGFGWLIGRFRRKCVAPGAAGADMQALILTGD